MYHTSKWSKWHWYDIGYSCSVAYGISVRHNYCKVAGSGKYIYGVWIGKE